MTETRRPTALQQTSRRNFLKTGGAVAGVFAAPLVLTGRKALAAPTEINMLAWYGHGEPDVVDEFEKMHNVKFKPKYYAGGDNMLALIAQSPPGTYDVILSDAEFVQQLDAAGYIEEMDPADYPLDDLFPEYRNFPGHWKDGRLYSVIVRFGYLGVSFNTTVVSHEEANDYDVLWMEKLAGKVGHFDWHLPNLGCLSLRDGNDDPSPFDIGDDQWRRLRETTLSLKPQVGGFFDYGGTFSSLKNGQIHAMCGIGDWITGVLRKDGAPIDSVVSEAGRHPVDGVVLDRQGVEEAGSGEEVHPVHDLGAGARCAPPGWRHTPASSPTARGGRRCRRRTPRRPSVRAWSSAGGTPWISAAKGGIHFRDSPQAAEPGGLERLLVRVQERMIRGGRAAPSPARLHFRLGVNDRRPTPVPAGAGGVAPGAAMAGNR